MKNKSSRKHKHTKSRYKPLSKKTYGLLSILGKNNTAAVPGIPSTGGSAGSQRPAPINIKMPQAQPQVQPQVQPQMRTQAPRPNPFMGPQMPQQFGASSPSKGAFAGSRPKMTRGAALANSVFGLQNQATQPTVSGLPEMPDPSNAGYVDMNNPNYGQAFQDSKEAIRQRAMEDAQMGGK